MNNKIILLCEFACDMWRELYILVVAPGDYPVSLIIFACSERVAPHSMQGALRIAKCKGALIHTKHHIWAQENILYKSSSTHQTLFLSPRKYSI